MLGLVIIIGGFSFSIYGNYLTAKASGGTMNQDEFKILADQFSAYFQLYVGLIWGLVGISVGTGLFLMCRSIWQYRKRGLDNKQQHEDDFEITVSTKEMDSILKKRNDYNKVKSKVDNFLNQMRKDDIKEGIDDETHKQ